MKEKKTIIIVSAVVLFLVLGAIVTILLKQPAQPATDALRDTQQAQEIIPTIPPSELGLVLKAREDKKAVKFLITNGKDITGIDYELSYIAQGNIPRGALGSLTTINGQTEFESKFIDLGTCSSGVCKYDQEVTSVKFILKIMKTDGKVYQATATLDL